MNFILSRQEPFDLGLNNEFSENNGCGLALVAIVQPLEGTGPINAGSLGAYRLIIRIAIQPSQAEIPANWAENEMTHGFSPPTGQTPVAIGTTRREAAEAYAGHSLP